MNQHFAVAFSTLSTKKITIIARISTTDPRKVATCHSLESVKFAHVTRAGSQQPELVAIDGEIAVPVAEFGERFETLQQLIEAGESPLEQIQKAFEVHAHQSGFHLSEVTFAPSVIRPPITLAVGLNYDEHANELHLDNDSGPVLFSLFPNSLNGHKQEVPIPTHLSEEVDYEGELGVIIGKPAKNVTPDEALDYVFGYTVVNDITARNIQFSEPQWSRCKSFDGFSPVGPFVVTADEIADPQQLHLTTDVDGVRVQDSSTSFMIRTVAELISSISQSLTLLPGTLISTGSPGGAGRSRKPPLYLVPGSTVTVAIENLGELTSYCVEATR